MTEPTSTRPLVLMWMEDDAAAAVVYEQLQQRYSFDYEIVRLLDREPFVPFVVVMTSGDRYEVSDPHSVALDDRPDAIGTGMVGRAVVHHERAPVGKGRVSGRQLHRGQAQPLAERVLGGRQLAGTLVGMPDDAGLLGRNIRGTGVDIDIHTGIEGLFYHDHDRKLKVEANADAGVGGGVGGQIAGGRAIRTEHGALSSRYVATLPSGLHLLAAPASPEAGPPPGLGGPAAPAAPAQSSPSSRHPRARRDPSWPQATGREA